MSRTDTQLELYLSLGEDLLPVKTPRGNYLIWHSLDCTNVLDRTRGWEDGRLVRPHFIAHRLGGAGGLFTNFGCCATHIFTMEFWENLPRALGGPLDNDHPPEGFEMRDCRSFIQEYFWQGWSGLQFEEVWNSHGG